MTIYTSLEEKEGNYNPNSWRVIDSKDELDSVIETFKDLRSSNGHILFRGICEAKYKLYTSLQRDCFSKNLNSNKVTQRDIVIKLLQEGRNNSSKFNVLPEYFAKMGIPLNDWILLALLQHYGAPSPLLDFTKDFIPALYFMCLGMNTYYSNNEIDHYFSIVYFKAVDACAHLFENLPKTALNIYKSQNPRPTSYAEKNKFILEELSFENIMNNRTLELIPSYKGVTNVRYGNKKWILNLPIANMNMTSQEGEFVCNLSNTEPIEQLMKKDGTNYLHCINIHKSLYHYIIRQYLKGSLEEMKKALFPTEYQAAEDIYSRTMSSLF